MIGSLRRIHLVLAGFTFAVFCATGAYFLFGLEGLAAVDLEVRAFYRSRHIYILMAALVHAGVGAYVRPSASPSTLRVQRVGSTLVTLATAGLIIAFFTEVHAADLRSEVSAFSIFALVGGVVLHLWASRGA